MKSEAGLVLGALYKIWKTDQGLLYSTAVITRPTHDRFSKYHEKSIPLFLPPDKDFLQLWLSKDIERHPEIDRVLNKPKLYYDLSVIEVKSYKTGEPLSSTELLARDE